MKRKLALCLVIGFMLTGVSSYASSEEKTDKPPIETPALETSGTMEDAADPNYQYALELERLNVFKGTGAGFELGRQPSRVEGAVMFVRLLGKEEEALEKQYVHPFTDVPEWANAYVGYLYEVGLAKGVGENKFGSNDILDLKSYLTFILRCLGYSDGNGDFQWDTVEDKAKDIKVVDEVMVTGDTFNRSELAKVSVTALNTQMKDSDLKLIETIKVPDSYDYYVAVPTNITEDNWLTDFAGGRENEITIQIGKIMKTNTDFSEVYIDLITDDQIITLAANGGYYEYYEGTTQCKKAVINFLTGKKFDGNDIVKDYSEGKIKIMLIIEYDEMGNCSPRVLCYTTGEVYNVDYPKDNYYELELKE